MKESEAGQTDANYSAPSSSRYYVTDNFLRSWLAALANPVSAIAFRPLDELIEEADQRLADVEGGSLEKLAGQLYEERSRKGIGDFPITHRVQGFWDKADTEIDLVAFNETTESIRFGSCKRSPKKLTKNATPSSSIEPNVKTQRFAA